MRFLPSYGAVQASMSAAFSTAPVAQGLAIQSLWLLGAALAAFMVFRRRTRDALPARSHSAYGPTDRRATGRPA